MTRGFAPKALLKQLASSLLERELPWRFFVASTHLARRASVATRLTSKYFPIALHTKHIKSRQRLGAITRGLSPQLRILAGPFQGMLYPSLQSCGSSLPPKILGTYERELFGVIATLRHYDELINVGAAEGYYSVGLVRKGVVGRALSYDPSETARAMCARLAEANNVSDRVFTRDLFSRGDLLALDPGTRRLVVSDCEGYERRLFDRETAAHLAKADVVIEVHEHRGASLADLRAAFEPTHQLKVIGSISDWERADYREPSVLRAFDRATRMLLTAELRADMSWLVARSMTV